MALDLTVIAANWWIIAVSVVAYMVLKFGAIFAIALALGSGRREALERAVLMAQGGEFAFVLYATATQVGLIDAQANAVLSATIILSMALTPLMIIAHDRLLPKAQQDMNGVEAAKELAGTALIIGFGRVGQVVSQPLLARGYTISIIETDTQMIRDAAEFGFKVYYGDGCRLDILHAAGAHTAKVIVVAVNNPAAASRIVELTRAEFPLVPVLVRAFDREHVLELIHAGAVFPVRETFEAAMILGERALLALGETPETTAEVMAEVRRRDEERHQVELVGGLYAGAGMLRGNTAAPPS
jgi:CPA2 family monovalent cation:H+ antiporter-2/glutathione-regulated potassium-efflux system protein KefB